MVMVDGKKIILIERKRREVVKGGEKLGKR